MRIHGVSPEFVAQMKSLLGKNFDVDDYVAFRIHGVSPNSSARVREHVSKDVTADQLVAMGIHGAGPGVREGDRFTARAQPHTSMNWSPFGFTVSARSSSDKCINSSPKTSPLTIW